MPFIAAASADCCRFHTPLFITLLFFTPRHFDIDY